MTKPGQTSLLNSRPPFVPPPGLTRYRTLRRRAAWCPVLTSCPLRWSLPLTFLERWLSFYNRLSVSVAKYMWHQGRGHFTIFHHLVLVPQIPQVATGNCASQISSSVLFPHPQAGTTNGAKRVWTPPHLSLQILNICSRPLLVPDTLLFTGVCLGSRAAGTASDCGTLAQVGSPRTVAAEDRHVSGSFCEESCFPPSLPERTVMCWLIGHSGFGLRNIGSCAYVPSLFNRSLSDCGWVSLSSHNNNSQTSLTQTPSVVMISLKRLEIKCLGNKISR